MFLNQFKLKSIAIILLSSSLAACGGGSGSGEDKSNQEPVTPPVVTPPPVTPPPVTPPPVTNTAPTIILSSTEATIDENDSFVLNFTTEDGEGDQLTITTNGGGSFVSSIVSSNSITFNSSEVDSDLSATFTIQVSDGKLSSTQSFKLNILNVEDEPEIKTTINLSKNNIELIQYEETFIPFTLANNADIDKSSFNANYDKNSFSVVEYVENEGLRIQSTDKLGNFAITFNINDINGVEAEPVTLYTTVIEDNSNVEKPVVTFQNTNGAYLDLEMQSHSTLTVPFTIEDTDSTEFTCQDTNIIGNDFEGFDYKINCTDRTIVFNTDFVESDKQVEFTFTVSDGENISNATTITMFVHKAENEVAEIEYNYEKPFFKLTENTSKTLSYTIKDDGTTEIEYSGVQHWYGNQSGYEITHNAENKTFNISVNSNLVAAETFGVMISFKDGSEYLNEYLEVKVIAEVGDIEERALELVKRYDNATKAAREYNLLGKAYTDYLFSVSKISYTEKEKFDSRFEADSRDVLGIYLQFRNNLQNSIDDGDFTEQPAYLNYYIDFFEDTLSELMKTGLLIESDLNELATLDQVLPSLTVSTTAINLDSVHFSRLIGDTNYGDYENDKWVFNNEYRFLKVISSLTNNSSFVD